MKDETKEQREKRLSGKRKHYYKNKDKILKKQKQFRNNNKELIKERKHKEYIKNKERYKKSNDKYYSENKEDMLKKNRKYRINNKEQISKQKKGYRLKHLEQEKITHLKNYLKNREMINKHSKKQDIKNRITLMNILGGPICLGCEYTDMRALQFDHINGGGCKDYKKFGNSRTMVRYYIKHPKEAKEKLQVLCANCNSVKRIEEKECSRNFKY